VYPVYRRPYFGQVFRPDGQRVGAQKVRYPYPASLFRQHDIFPLFALDGGAFFFTMEHLKGATGADFLAALETGELLAPWMVDGKLQWDKVYDDTWADGDRWKAEQHVWLNRLYFLLPIAQQAFRTGHKKWSRLWFKHFRAWSRAHPRPDGAPWTDGAKYVWRDMQVTWRLLVLLHSVFMLGRSAGLGRGDWAAIYDSILEHAEHVYAEAKADFRDDRPGNHFLQKGMALILAGTLFPEFPRAHSYLTLGRRIIREQMGTEIYADGGSIEASPSYSHFIARTYLDAHLALQANGLPRIRDLESCIRRQYAFLRETATPDGRTLQLGDSYTMDAELDLRIVSKLLPLDLQSEPPTGSRAFKESCFAVLRSGRLTAYVDGMPFGAWHCHMGKPNLVAYWDGKPVLVDAGCCNYDLPEHRDWFQTAPAHNVVLVEPQEADLPISRTNAPAMKLTAFRTSSRGSQATFTHRFASSDFDYVWTRKIRLDGETLTLADRVHCSAPARCTLLLHFAPSRIRALRGGGQINVCGEGWELAMHDEVGQAIELHRSKRPAMDASNLPYDAPMLALSRAGRDVEFRYVCSFA